MLVVKPSPALATVTIYGHLPHLVDYSPSVIGGQVFIWAPDEARVQGEDIRDGKGNYVQSVLMGSLTGVSDVEAKDNTETS
jgi:hypothetical protein